MQLITQKFISNLEMLKYVTRITTFTPFSYSTKIICAFPIKFLPAIIFGKDIFFSFEANHLLLQFHK